MLLKLLHTGGLVNWPQRNLVEGLFSRRRSSCRLLSSGEGFQCGCSGIDLDFASTIIAEVTEATHHHRADWKWLLGHHQPPNGLEKCVSSRKNANSAVQLMGSQYDFSLCYGHDYWMSFIFQCIRWLVEHIGFSLAIMY